MPIKPNLIGRREFASLPEFNMEGIEAKIDTGAYTSSLHCSYIRTFEEDGLSMVAFKLLDKNHPQYNNTLHTARVLKSKRIRSSNGLMQVRFIIKTTIQINGKSLKTEFSLTDRSAMRYPLLIGRKTLQGKFIVDVNKLHIGGNPYSIKE